MPETTVTLPSATRLSIPEPGQTVCVRLRTYLVEGVETNPGSGTIVRLACLDDDAQGDQLDVLWELELGAEIIGEDAWRSIGNKGFDQKEWFSAYLHTLRWNCVTATDPRLFQAPFRAGIKIDAYQLEPLRKALLLPRVNLFIADDVGLGKTVEAGLIATELILRRRAREIVVACPPSMIPQWQDEMEARFGLVFEVLDREYIERVRREQGFGVNPWTTFPRFLISHQLLIDEDYAGPLRSWLDTLRPGTLLILDEAHHAAPSSGARYAIDSRITRAIRDIAPRFEHRLFLSATPHNGHSNSFSALLELLDPQRFTRGVKVLARNRDEVMVRRLKVDIRELQGGFPKRTVRQIDLPEALGLARLPEETPELRLSVLLNEYRDVRQRRLAGATKRQQSQGALLISGLQQRLLSSVESFARTLAVHRRTMERIWAGERVEAGRSEAESIARAPDPEDDTTTLSDVEQDELEAATFRRATAATAGSATTADIERERAMLAEMEKVADRGRGEPDARVKYLLGWIRKNMCPAAYVPGEPSSTAGAAWTPIRLLIFTEYEDTRRWIATMLKQAIRHTDSAEHRIEVYSGATSQDRRRAIQRAFNASPNDNALRILIATDAAREGLNLQAHCYNLFHFDVPWNPSRLEQRNGRIDRKLQPQPEVFCHYFLYTQRTEDRVLRTLVRKTEKIRDELGSLSQVLESRLADMLQSGGIRHADVERLAAEIDAVAPDPDQRAVVNEELEETRTRRAALEREIDRVRNDLESSRRRIGLDMEAFRDALSCSLEMVGVEPLEAAKTPRGEPPRYVFPNLGSRHGGDPAWANTLDTLRELPEDGNRTFLWRRESPIRPVIFQAADTMSDEAVQLHLSHRVAQRLLSRFTAQGFVYHDLSRACLAVSDDSIPRVVLVGRLSLYGKGAVRLHEELVTVTARWSQPDIRQGPLTPFARDGEARTMELLESAMRPGLNSVPKLVTDRLQGSMVRDMGELLPHLHSRGGLARDEATRKLDDRGRIEADAMRDVLDNQRKRVEQQAAKSQQILPGVLAPDEERQLAADRRAWTRFIERAEVDRVREPERIRAFYNVTSSRIEAVALCYLWPVTG